MLSVMQKAEGINRLGRLIQNAACPAFLRLLPCAVLNTQQIHCSGVRKFWPPTSFALWKAPINRVSFATTGQAFDISEAGIRLITHARPPIVRALSQGCAWRQILSRLFSSSLSWYYLLCRRALAFGISKRPRFEAGQCRRRRCSRETSAMAVFRSSIKTNDKATRLRPIGRGQKRRMVLPSYQHQRG